MNREWKNRIKIYLLLMPALAILLGIFAAGLVLGLLQSLGYSPLSGEFSFTAENYIVAFSDEGFMRSTLFSLKTAALSSAISVIIGVMLAYAISRSKKGLNFEKTAYKVPVVVPHIVAALIAYSLLSQSGILARLAYMAGLIESQNEFPVLLFDKEGIGIIAAYVWKGAPYIAMVTYGILRGVNENLIDAARNLGASEKEVFKEILFPMALPTISSSFIIIFAFSFGAFEIPFLLGPTKPRALPVEAYIEYISPDWSKKPYAMAINMVITAISLALIWGYQKLFQKAKERRR